ncbi:hypothetical protein Celal_4069 [Cellulophaga algicola DSM 14237]|uniref:Uncharacterized protein n=1 Tax=Cellulophaga algicola (strain DSM 14237 / IC166 / ACAM 630) TaxID=688270 RepID=E6XDX4_CELAD|nr:hypothetical protein Celal_4069 [Cellulophaga algicola DSM 14237]
MLFKTLGKKVQIKNSYTVKAIMGCFFATVLIKHSFANTKPDKLYDETYVSILPN